MCSVESQVRSPTTAAGIGVSQGCAACVSIQSVCKPRPTSLPTPSPGWACSTMVVSVRGARVASRSTASARRQASSRASARSVGRDGTCRSGSSSASRVYWRNSSSAMALSDSLTTRSCSAVSSPRSIVSPVVGESRSRLRASSALGSNGPSSSRSSARAVRSARQSANTVSGARSSRSGSWWDRAAALRSLTASATARACSAPMRPALSASSTTPRSDDSRFAIRRRSRATPWGRAALARQPLRGGEPGGAVGGAPVVQLGECVRPRWRRRHDGAVPRRARRRRGWSRRARRRRAGQPMRAPDQRLRPAHGPGIRRPARQSARRPRRWRRDRPDRAARTCVRCYRSGWDSERVLAARAVPRARRRFEVRSALRRRIDGPTDHRPTSSQRSPRKRTS